MNPWLQSAHQLLALGCGVVGQGLDLHLIRAAGLGRALLRELFLPTVVRIG